MNMKFEKPTFDFLRKMGWTEHRAVDPAPFLACLVADGYELFPKARPFFQRFGGLGGDMPAYRVAGAFDRIDFHPAHAISCTCREQVSAYEARVHQKLVVIGMAYNSHMTLLLSDTGRMYGGYDDFLCLIGNDVHDGITNLFGRRQMPEVL
ncbi:SUKH-3 domain-containing protein [Massilia sp. CCM 9210]|uniref:SUKH-3 domain-containing protein n=1 Tax=Massilia scottii TaxID=3057166 RepID=UPI002796E14E|nr:SUKH-3 domain-containing protein [Massilia sp. CCM 9210]MDQ1817396.1 SUKH-3 domain-containing protein [Massilia sp. CCM 9210]